MNKEILFKLAELSTFLDNRGHKEESHLLDHKLMSIAQGKTLRVGTNTYRSAAEAWRAYDGSTNYRDFVYALGLTGTPPSEDIKRAIDEYFGVPEAVKKPEGPGQVVDEKGATKPAREWYDPRGWDVPTFNLFKKPYYGGQTER